MPTRCAGRSGWFVRIGRPRYTCIESAETISAGISAAIASATAVLPDAVGPKTASTSGSGGDERLLRPAERRRRRGSDQHRDEVSAYGVALEVHGRVATGASAQERRVGPARPLHQHFLLTPDPPPVPVGGDALDELDQPLDAFTLDLFRYLVGHSGRLGAAPRRVDERERAVEADLLDHLERLAEVRLGLAGEAGDDVGRQRQVGDRAA